MKKYLLSFLICILALPLMLAGCTPAPLLNAPTETANFKTIGSALKYDNYIYFANAFQSSSAMEEGYDVNNTAIKRIAVSENNTIALDEETSLPTGQENVIAKVVGSEYTFMYSSGKYIYFAAPSQEINPATHGEHFYTYNEYFRIATDGTGLTKFYTSNNSITKQTVLKIDGKEYLVLVNGTQLVKIELGDKISKPVVLAKDFTAAIFAESYTQDGDQVAYYTTALPEGSEYIGQTGNLLYGVDIVTGESILKDGNEPKALNATKVRTIALKHIENGHLFFTIKEQVAGTELDETYVMLTSIDGFTYSEIQTGLASITGFDVLWGEDEKEYYVFTDSTAGTYGLQSGNTNVADGKLIDQEIKILFTSGDYVYFVYKDTEANAEGMHRISVRGTNPQVEIINSVSDFKDTNITFDGTYVYFFALNTDNTTGTYYMHRSRVDINQANLELLSTLLDDDKPETEEE